MKVSLIVAQGVHQGKVIPIPVPQFLIGRDESCQLRPSSPAISKKHFGIIVKAGKIYVQDFGSTNGTFVNETQVSGEIEVKDGDKLRAGPLEFTLKIERSPFPSRNQPRPSAVDTPTPPPKEAPTKEEKTVAAKPAGDEHDADKIAAMLLATDDNPGEGGAVTPDQIPAGSTVFDMNPATGEMAKKDEKKAPPPEQDNSKRAAEILRKYMQRPRTT